MTDTYAQNKYEKRTMREIVPLSVDCLEPERMSSDGRENLQSRNL